MNITIKQTDFYKYFFLLFIFFMPFQTRKVFLTDHSFYTGSFTEYGTVFLYLSDILFLLAFVSLAIFNPDIIKKGLNQAKRKSGKSAPHQFFPYFLLLIGIYFLSSFLHPAYPEVSLFRSFKMIDVFLLVFFVFCTFKDKRMFSSSLFVLILSASFQSIIAIYQFLYQRSVFISPLLHKLTGETILGPYLPGIAKIGEGSEKMIRAYGTFPHPNPLGGFLLLSIFISLYLYFEHKRDYLSSPLLKDHKGINALSKHIIPPFWVTLFISQSIALFISFSRSAWLGLVIGSFTWILLELSYTKIVSRETIHSYLRKYPELSISLLLLSIFLIANASIVSTRFLQDSSIDSNAPKEIVLTPQNDTFSDRTFFNDVSRETISSYPLLGSGPGTSLFQIKPHLIKQGSPSNMEPWQYQPPHNIYMLSTAETGLLGLALFIYLVVFSITKAFRDIVSRETNYDYKIFKTCALSIMAGFLFIGVFDHYFITLQQGILMFWILISFLII